jgi:Lrp/AsnC family leucine-responsive transcriptional regulator
MTTVFVEITLQSQAEDLLDAFEREASKVPDILECHLMAGSADYLLKIASWPRIPRISPASTAGS